MYFSLHPWQRCNTCLQSYLVGDKYCYTRVIRLKSIKNPDAKCEVIVHHTKRSKTRESGIKCTNNLANKSCLVIGTRGKYLGEQNVVRGAITLYMEGGAYLLNSKCEIKTIASSMPFSLTNHHRKLNELLNHPRSRQ